MFLETSLHPTSSHCPLTIKRGEPLCRVLSPKFLSWAATRIVLTSLIAHITADAGNSLNLCVVVRDIRLSTLVGKFYSVSWNNNYITNNSSLSQSKDCYSFDFIYSILWRTTRTRTRKKKQKKNRMQTPLLRYEKMFGVIYGKENCPTHPLTHPHPGRSPPY